MNIRILNLEAIETYKMVDEINEVKVGMKDMQSYIYAVLRNSNVLLKARGSNMKRSIDVALISERDYNYKIEDVRIYNSTYTDESGKERKVSNLEISLSK